MASTPPACVPESESVDAATSGYGAPLDGSPRERLDRTARASDPLLGSVIDGRYLIESAAGSGGFGDVYRAVHLHFDSPVAIKVLRVTDGWLDTERLRFVDLFLAEGKLLFNLSGLHPAIVRVFEAGTLRAADGSLAPYFVMEWLQGASLDREVRARAARGPARFELSEVIALLDASVQGLATAHSKGVAHRDIKPANIFLVRDGERIASKLLDFGLAKATTDTAAAFASLACGAVSEVPFTPAYAAPEQWTRSLGPTGPWTDVYALALVCSELVSGARAFRGHNRQHLMAACLDAQRRPTPKTLGGSIPDAIESVFERALAVDPAQRYGGATEFWTALCDAAIDAGLSISTGRRVALFNLAASDASGDDHPERASATRSTAAANHTPRPTEERAAPARHRRSTGFSAAAALLASLIISPSSSSNAGEPQRASPANPSRARTADEPLSKPPSVHLTVRSQLSDNSLVAPATGLARPDARPASRFARGHKHVAVSFVAPETPAPRTAPAASNEVTPQAPAEAFDIASLLNHDALSRRK